MGWEGSQGAYRITIVVNYRVALFFLKQWFTVMSLNALLTLTEISNLFFIGLFTVEMLLKMYSLGLQNYLMSLFNRFDCFVVLCSIVEAIFNYSDVMPSLGVSVLRCARLLRVFKATRYIYLLYQIADAL